jgi:hypothetical protein
MKRRGLALNINPLALLPGSKPLKTPKSPITPPTEPAVVPAVNTPPVEEVKDNKSTPEPEPVPEVTTPDAASFDIVPSGASQLSHLGKVNKILVVQKYK